MFVSVLNQPWSDGSNLLKTLNKWYVVLDQWGSWDYIKVKMTDNTYWYILKILLADNSTNKYAIWDNYWKTSSNTILFDKPEVNASKKFTIYKWMVFKILHVNYINDNYIKVKILSWKYQNKVWYINKNYVSLYTIEWYKNEVATFIEKNTPKNKKILTSKKTKEVNLELNSAKEQDSVAPSTSTTTKTSTWTNNLNEEDDFMNSLNSIFNDDSSTTPSPSPAPTPTTPSPAPINNSNEEDDFMNSLNELFK